MAWHSSVSVRILLIGILLASLTVIAAEATLVAEPVEAIPRHSLHVTLYPDSLDAKITNTQLGAVTFGGNVTVEKPQGVERVTVTLVADTDKGWPVVTSPSTIAFINPGTERFTVTVIVPDGTPPTIGTVTVTAQATSPIWSETETAEALVNVIQFYEFQTWIDGTLGNGIPGGSISGELIIFNNGTGEDTFHISLEDIPDAVTSWDVPDSVTIPSRMEMEVQFTLGLDDDYDVPYAGQMFTLVFKVRSAGRADSDILREHTVLYFLYFEGLEGKLVNNWPTYVGYGVVIVLAIVVSVIVFKRVRRSKVDLPEPEGTEL
jgi:sporulation-control protein spo0M